MQKTNQHDNLYVIRAFCMVFYKLWQQNDPVYQTIQEKMSIIWENCEEFDSTAEVLDNLVTELDDLAEEFDEFNRLYEETHTELRKMKTGRLRGDAYALTLSDDSPISSGDALSVLQKIFSESEDSYSLDVFKFASACRPIDIINNCVENVLKSVGCKIEASNILALLPLSISSTQRTDDLEGIYPLPSSMKVIQEQDVKVNVNELPRSTMSWIFPDFQFDDEDSYYDTGI